MKENFEITLDMAIRLFNNHILFAPSVEGENQDAVYLTLVNKFGAKVIDEESYNLLYPGILRLFEIVYRKPLGEPFYRNFPESVKKLSDEEIVIDRLLHYAQTYGTGDHETRHFSLFEKEVAKTFFNEDVELKTFKVVTQDIAVKELCHIADNLLMRRQIQSDDLDFIVEMMSHNYIPDKISSKQIMCLLIRKIRETSGEDKVISFIDRYRAFDLNDIIRLIGWTNATDNNYSDPKLNKLNLSNKDRKFYTKLIEHVAARSTNDDILNAVEKRKTWKGILHHIHFKAKGNNAAAFANIIFDDDVKSIYSLIESLFAKHDIINAAKTLVENKGATALMRSINRYLCATNNESEKMEIIKLAISDSLNPIAAMQTALSYLVPTVNGYNHTFSYNYYGRTITHKDDRDSRPELNKPDKILLASYIKDNLKFTNTGKKIYIDPKAEQYAMPLWPDELNGVGVLTTGSRIDIPDTKVLRVFVYWEKERDLDLSGIAISREKGIREFSWRSTHNSANEGIVFSGDVTDGVNGGAEYFDIDFGAVRKYYGDFDYMVFNVNNFSAHYHGFNEFTARAGFMTRDKISSGEIFEPKTVKGTFDLTAKTRQATMFAIDLKTRQLVWINKAPESGAVAGESPVTVYLKYIDVVKLFNLKWFFEKIAGAIVSNPEDADIIVSDDISLSTDDKVFVNISDSNAALEYLNAK